MPNPPDAEVEFEFTALTHDGKRRTVFSGYRPIYDILPDYWTSTRHEFIEHAEVSTGQRVHAHVWFITPEVYPRTLWPRRILTVAEGKRVVGIATVIKVLNPSLLRQDDGK